MVHAGAEGRVKRKFDLVMKSSGDLVCHLAPCHHSHNTSRPISTFPKTTSPLQHGSAQDCRFNVCRMCWIQPIGRLIGIAVQKQRPRRGQCRSCQRRLTLRCDWGLCSVSPLGTRQVKFVLSRSKTFMQVTWALHFVASVVSPFLVSLSSAYFMYKCKCTCCKSSVRKLHAACCRIPRGKGLRRGNLKGAPEWRRMTWRTCSSGCSNDRSAALLPRLSLQTLFCQCGNTGRSLQDALVEKKRTDQSDVQFKSVCRVGGISSSCRRRQTSQRSG